LGNLTYHTAAPQPREPPNRQSLWGAD
jgi:hypothetical protein